MSKLHTQKPYAALFLTEESKFFVSTRFSQRYSVRSTDHITIVHDCVDTDRLFIPETVKAVAHLDDGYGLEALLISVDGSTKRPEGGYWHVTLSYDAGMPVPEGIYPGYEGPYRAKLANDMLRAALTDSNKAIAVDYFDTPIPLSVFPAVQTPRGSYLRGDKPAEQQPNEQRSPQLVPEI